MKKTLLFFALAILSLLVSCGGGGDDSTVEYNISWMDETGTLITTTKVKEGEIPTYTYDKPDTAEWDYSFLGWKSNADGEVLSQLPLADSDATYYAKISQTKRTYTVSFVTNGGSAIANQTVEYGSEATKPEDPVYEGYRFMGWYTDANLTVEADFSADILANTSYYAAWNEQIDVVNLLQTLLGGYKLNPYSYIPESMLPGYEANAISNSAANIDYSDFVNVSDIPSGGFGEQWNMILDNLNQSMIFFNVLSVVDGISSTSVSIFNNYFDENPDDTAHHSFENGIYNVTVDFDGEIIFYVLDYNASVGSLGEQSVQIALAMNTETSTKSARIQIGDANALTYTVADNYYEFAIKYLGMRSSYFKITRNAENEISGHIYEYLTVSSVEIASAADFYINEDYVCAVGNKAGSMIGFDGYICETYNADSGKMLGYEVMETESNLDVTYNTLWFDLNKISGINSIKYVDGTGGSASAFYVNGLSDAWESKKVGGLSLKSLSRRFDIEFRTQYFYVYDSVNDVYNSVKVEVPMLFVQEENYETLAEDILSANEITVTVSVSNQNLEIITSNYELFVNTFIENKNNVTADSIINRIGAKISFDQ